MDRVKWSTALIVLMVATWPISAAGQTPEEVFRQNCMSCHTIGGGRLSGPDLKGVQTRRDREWLARFIKDPQAVLNSGDPYAQALLDDARGVVMPSVPGLTAGMIEALLDLIVAEGERPDSPFAGSQISDRPFTPADRTAGRDLFVGQKQFANGGAACGSCHTVRDLGGLSGGRLGPDLTKVYERIGNRPALAAWLQGPATTTMRPLFAEQPLKADEILSLVAFFEATAGASADDDRVASLNFFLIGILGAAVLLALFDAAWRRRFRSVRKPLVRMGREVSR